MAVYDRLLTNVTSMNSFGESLKEQAIGITNGQIAWCGPMSDLPANYQNVSQIIEDCAGDLITPGLINCHTHLVYAGDRAHEFRLRLDGATYSEIAKQGGGILSTVEKTRSASKDELIEQSLPRLLAMRSEGVTTVEIKSGYGLDLETEVKMLEVARELGNLSKVRIKTTFLGAHAVPKEYWGRADDYVRFLCEEVLPLVAEEKLADAVDVFCESISFNLAQTDKIFSKASALSLPIKCHAEQLSNLGASELAANYAALSCDHLEYIDLKGVEALAKNNTVAVLLPGAFYFLGEKKKPPVEIFRQKKVGMAIATDTNPGSSPTTSLLMMMSMACNFFGLTTGEVLSGVTYWAACALGMEKEIGSIHVGLKADLVQWQVKNSEILCYYFGYPLNHKTMIAGEWL